MNDGTKTLLARAQLVLRPLAFGDVPSDPAIADEASSPVKYRQPRDRHVALAAIGRRSSELKISEWQVRIECLTVLAPALLVRLKVGHFPPDSCRSRSPAPARSPIYLQSANWSICALRSRTVVAPRRVARSSQAAVRAADCLQKRSAGYASISMTTSDNASVWNCWRSSQILSVCYFVRAFKRSMSVTPHEYLIRRRVELTMRLLSKTDMPLSEIALAAGFVDQSHCARRFRQHVGMSPRDYRWLTS